MCASDRLRRYRYHYQTTRCTDRECLGLAPSLAKGQYRRMRMLLLCLGFSFASGGVADKYSTKNEMERSARTVFCIGSDRDKGRRLTCIEEENELVHEPGHARHAHLQCEHQQPHEPNQAKGSVRSYSVAGRDGSV